MTALETPYEAPSATSEPSVVNHVQLAEDLRAAADLIEQFPAEAGDFGCASILVSFYGSNAKEQMQKVARIPGKWTKGDSDYLYELTQRIGNVKVSAQSSRSRICRAVKVEETVPEQVLPAIPAQEERVIPAYVRTVTKWECEPLLGTSE